MAQLVRGAALLVGALVAACTSDAEPPDPARPAEAMGARVPLEDPAGAVADGSASADAGTVFRSDFEAASATCNGWRVEAADAIRSVPPRSGSYACKVCGDSGGGEGFALVRDLGQAKRGRYALRAFVRVRAGLSPADDVGLELRAGGASVTSASTGSPLDETWRELTTELVVDEDAPSMQVSVVARGVGACVLVDDVELLLATP